MPATSAYQAGIEANATQYSYGVEAVWGTAPATTFQAVRYTGEGLKRKKTRARPQEINLTREMSAAVTTSDGADGPVNIALSFGTYDDWISGLLGNDWQTPQAIAGVAGDITITSGTGVLSSTTAGKFTNISAGQYIRLLGFTNAANNGIFKVISKASAQSITLAPMGATLVTETPAGTAAQIRASTIKNGTQFKSFFVQQMLSPNKYYQYPGCYMSGGSLQGDTQNFLTGSFNMIAQSELTATADASTGGIIAAPSGRVHDSVGGFGGAFWNETPLTSPVLSFAFTINNAGAAAEYGMGSTKAVGILAGQMECSGKLKIYFKDFSYYAIFAAETQGTLAIITKDAAGNAYVIQYTGAVLMNPDSSVTAPNGAITCEFDIEGNPASGGGTVTIDRLPAT